MLGGVSRSRALASAVALVAVGPFGCSSGSQGAADRVGALPVASSSGVASSLPTVSASSPTAPASSLAPSPSPSPSLSTSSSVAPLRPLPDRPDVELFREIGSGLRAASEILDATRGVALVSDGNTPCDIDCPPVDQLLCGAAGAVEITELARSAVADVTDPPTEALACTGMTCVKQARYEWDPEETFQFRAKKGGGVTLVSVTQLDVLLRNDADVAADRAKFPPRLSALATRTCPSL